MDLPGIVRALQQGDDVSLAIDTLLNYNHPLTAKEQQQLTAFLELQAEQREGGLKVDEPTEEIEQLRRRPLQQAFHPLMVLQCIMSAAKLPYLTKDHQRRLQKTVLPFVAAHTPLSMEEWYMAMCVAQVQLSVATSTTALRCAEELLRCAAPVVLRCPATVVSALHRQHPHMAVKVAPRKESATPKLKEMSGNDAEKLFMKLLAAVVRAYAVQHANSAKHSRREVPTPGERFPTCHAMRRVMGTLQRCINVSGGEASVSVPESAFFTAVATLSAVEVLALSLLAPWMPAMTKDLLAAAIKTDADEVLALLGGTRAVADVLRLAPTSSCADVLQYCLYTMGLTTTTEVQYRALLAILVALPVEETSAVFLERGKDAVAQLLHPFVANAKGLTPEVAKEVAPQVARLCTHMMMVSATEVRESTFIPLTTAVVQAAAYSLTSRCRAVPEKESVLRIIHAIFAQLPCSVMDRVPRKELVAVLNREISLPVAASMGQALRVASVLHLTAQVADGLRDAVRASAKEDEVRRALLVFLTEDEAVPEEVVASLVSGVLEDCVEVHTSRPDAFLALGLICSTNTERVRQLLPMLSSAEVLGQLQGCHEERMAAGRVASRLAAVGCFAPCAMLLTAPRGDVRLLMEDQLSTTMAKDPTTSLALWRAWVEEVFLLHKESSAALLCEDGSSLPAFVKLGQAVLHHLPQLYQRAAVKLLAELLMCCGHDHVQGADPGFFLAARQRRRYDGSGFGILRTSIFGRIFPGQADMLMEHAGEVMEVLCTSFTTSEHVSTAAARAVVLLLTKLSGEAASCVADQLLRAARTSMDFFVALNERDRAIAAECADAMWSYEEATLREQQLLKTYTERAPKGMSEDDFADLKKRDALALEKGRAALHADVAKRTLTLQRTARLHKTSLHTIRHLGQHGHFPLAAVATLYPYLQSCLNETTHPVVVKSLALDAVVGLLSRTPLAHLVEPMVLTVARLVDEKYLTAKDVSQIASLAQMLRVELQQMLPAPLVVLLTAFDQVAFKAGRGLNATSTTIPVATQHQLLGLLLQNIGQAHLPQPAVVLALLTTILQRFAPLYKSVQQGVQTLMPMVPSADLATIEAALLGGSDSVREVVAGSYQRFSHFDGNRRALVLAAIFMKDPATAVVRGMESVLADERWSWELLPSDWSDVLYYLQTFGQSSANALRIASLMADLFAAPTTTDEAQHAWLAEIIAINGVAAVVAVQTLSPALRGACPVAVMSYLSTLIEQPTTTEALMKLALNSGRVVLKGMPLETLRGLSSDVQARLAKPPKEATEAQREQYLATATVWLTILSCRLQETALIESIMDQQSRTLNNSQSAMVHRCVGESMAEITRNEQARRSPSLDLFMEKCSKQVFHSGSYIKKKAHAWGMVGVLQGIGLPALARFGIMETLNKAATEKQNEKAGAMILLEVLCAVMGKTVEPYALSLVPFLLESVADADPKISECADDAARVMMSSLTAVGLRQLVPTLVAGLSCDQAKKRVPPLNFIGYVAFCSPKQLAAALPEIMKHITPCLFDVNGSVTVAAFNALRRVAGVVSNPEIQEHVELILNAMRNPSSDTENALDALLYTRFVNVVDPASLALIIPVISRGLSGQVAHTRPKAAQIVASMVSLVGDAKTLQPYAEELVKLLESAAQDPLTEARTTAAKAVGALASAVGGDFIDMVATWCFGVLQKTQTGAIEKAGAAQVFVELVSSCGYELLVAFLSTIEAGMTDERPPIREGFLYIMVYAPSTLRTEDFQQLLPLAFPWVLDGLSHFSDKVRDVALGAGDSIISLYGTRNLPLVLKPLLEGVANEITTMRQSSLLLSSKLMLHLVASIKKKMRLQLAQEAAAADEGADGGGMAMDPLADEEGGGVLTMEAARDVEKRGISILGSLEEMLGTDSLVRMLSAIYCGRHEHSLNVRTDCNMAWQACVASIRAAVGKIFDALVQLLTHFCSSDNPDCVEVAEKSIEFTTRMNETIERFINVFCDNYKSEHHRTKLGSLTALGVVVQYADSKRLMSMGGQIVGCVLPGMQDESDAVKDAARIVFARVTKSVGSRLIEGAVEAQISTSVRGVVEVVKVKPSIALALVFKHLNELTEYSESNVELIDCILDVEEAEEELEHYDEDITRILLACAVQGIATTSEVAQRFFDSLPEDREAQPLESFHKALNVPRTRLGALILAEAYGLGASLANLDGIEAVFRAAIDALGDAAEDSRAQAVATITGLISSLEQRVVDELAEEEQGDVTVSKRAAGRYLIQFLEVFQVALASTASACMSSSGEEHFAVLGEGEPRLFDVLMALYNRGLDYGTATQKVEAVECIQDLMRFAPRAISATASNTVAGRCSKVLFTRNEGSVVLALVRLCLQLMDYPASGKEKMVEGTMALAVYNAALCDSGEARALALRIVISLLKRSEKYADLILGTVVTKRAAADSPLLRTVMCRFISVVMRYANFEKSFPHIIKLMEVVRPMWESPTSPAQAVAAGVAVGALAKSASVPDDVLRDIKERTLALTAVKGVQALAGYALVYSLLNAAPARADQTFLEVAAEQVSLAAGYASDKLSTLWVLRAAGAIATTGCISQANFRIETYVPLLRRLGGNNEEQSLSTAQYFFDCVSGAYPSMYNSLDSFGREPSALWQIVGHFDADLDDEVVADTVM